MVLLSIRTELAGYLSALLLVYSILIVAWVLKSWIIVSGANVGWLYPAFRFLDSTVGPLMSFLRRFIPPLGPVDISPIVALLAVQIGGGLVVRLIGG